jgi:hypothetical protein
VSTGEIDLDVVLASWDAAASSNPTANPTAARRLNKVPGNSVLDVIGGDNIGKWLLRLGFVKGLISSRLGLEITCPWEEEHTVKTTTGAAYFPKHGGFECHHGHCQAAGRDGKALAAWLKDYVDGSGLWDGGIDGELFEPVTDAAGGGGGVDDPPPYRVTLVAQYVFVENEGSYLDLKSGELITIAVLNDVRREQMRSWLDYTVKGAGGKETVKSLTVHQWFLRNGGRVATRMMYWPGREVFFNDEDGVPVVNRYKAPPRPLLGRGAVGEKDVAPYVGLVRDLCVNEGPDVADRVLDLLALIVHEPGIKPGFGLLLQSEVQGLGKDLILVPVIWAVGEDNCAQPSLGEVTEKFNPWAGKRLVVVSDPERNTRGSPTMRDFYATIKPYTQNVSTTIDIRDLGRKYRARNVSAWVITANPDNALPVDATDRRFLVVMSTMPRKSGTWYAAHVAWQNSHLDLIGEYLHQRCEAMPAGRRAALLDTAPMTPGKTVMAQLGEDVLKSWVREQIENGRWPDLMTSEDVRDRLAEAGRRGEISRPLPSEKRMGSVLKSLGGGKVYAGGQLFVLGRHTRLWAVRNARQFDGWSAKALNDAYKAYNTLFASV